MCVEERPEGLRIEDPQAHSAVEPPCGEESSDEIYETESEQLHNLFDSIRKFILEVPDFAELDETIGIVKQKLIELENKYLKDIVKFVEIELFDHDVFVSSRFKKK